jgi:hypothetical protein
MPIRSLFWRRTGERSAGNVALGILEKAGAVGRTSNRLFCDPAKLATIAQAQQV